MGRYVFKCEFTLVADEDKVMEIEQVKRCFTEGAIQLENFKMECTDENGDDIVGDIDMGEMVIRLIKGEEA